ncbi:MFS transporter [Paenibacillus sp. MBLB4367]|uniref:MFS transporter n=1 Tax=Paenibacillus sp. MBLB4367 TaxID=3384767 RepID=UPI0039082A8B
MALISHMRTYWQNRPQIPQEMRLSADAKMSLLLHGSFQFGASMSGLFLNLYLWRLTESLWVNGLYNIIVYAISPFAFALGGWIVKKKDRMYTYRIGVMLIALFYLAVVIAQENVAEFYYLFAICNGIASAFYWSAYLTLMYDVSTEQNRIRYLAFNMISFTAAGLVGPALAGFVISKNDGLQGYIIVFTLAFVMFVLTTLGSFRIKAIASRHKAYYLKLAGIMMKRNKAWLHSLFAFFVLGLFQGIMLFLPNIMLFQTIPREDWVGYFGVLFSFVTIVAGYLISRFAKSHLGRLYSFIAACGFVIGALLLFWQISLFTVVLFMVMYSLCNPLQGNSITSYYYTMIGKLPLKGHFRVESVVARESFVNAGRVISIFAFIWLVPDMTGYWLPGVLLVCALAQFAIVFLLKKGGV